MANEFVVVTMRGEILGEEEKSLSLETL